VKQKTKKNGVLVIQKKIDSLLIDLTNSQDGPNNIPTPSPRSSPVPVAITSKEEKWGRWGPADASPILLRGKTYAEDQRKVPNLGCQFELVHVDIFSCSTRLSHVASRPDSYCCKRPSNLLNRLVFVVNWQVPGDPECNWVTYFQNKVPDDGIDLDIKEKSKKELEEEEQGSTIQEESASVVEESETVKLKDEKEIEKERIAQRAVFIRSLSRFLKGSEQYRHQRFKFIPRIVEGNWMVQKAVGTTPAILGTKMTQSYHYNKSLNYFEVDVDVGSSSVAKRILNLVRGYAKSITIDCLFLIEGRRADELPEQLLGGVRLSGVDYTQFSEAPEYMIKQRTNSTGTDTTNKKRDSLSR